MLYVDTVWISVVNLLLILALKLYEISTVCQTYYAGKHYEKKVFITSLDRLRLWELVTTSLVNNSIGHYAISSFCTRQIGQPTMLLLREFHSIKIYYYYDKLAGHVSDIIYIRFIVCRRVCYRVLHGAGPDSLFGRRYSSLDALHTCLGKYLWHDLIGCFTNYVVVGIGFNFFLHQLPFYFVCVLAPHVQMYASVFVVDSMFMYVKSCQVFG